jgi:hypothetical protein
MRQRGSASATGLNSSIAGAKGYVSLGQIQQALQRWIAPGRPVAPPTANTLYFIYLTPSTTVTVVFNKVTDASCGATIHRCINNAMN